FNPNIASDLKKERDKKHAKNLALIHSHSSKERWTSGNKQIDMVIKASRGEWKWIEPIQLTNITHLADGGLSTVYTATWHDNDCKDKEAKTVALKTINFTNNNASKALNEMANLSKFNFVNYTHGITKHLDSYAIVMNYFPGGDLRKFLQRNKNLSWDLRFEFLYRLLAQLSSLHSRGIIHGDLHSGNILINDVNTPFISDLGLSSVIMHKNATGDEVYGCIPYMAPELFVGKPHSPASDMYAMGIIMWEISAGALPFCDRNHNAFLIYDICKGLRPPTIEGTPECWIEVMERCWANNPMLRPDSFNLYTEVAELKGKPDVKKKLEEADEFQKEHPSSQGNGSHSITEYVNSFISCITEDELLDINYTIEN
ncbi:35931_t:CDS:2, partial [Racocetra persica]